MATVTDVEVANQSFPNVRQDLNDILEALATNFSADAEPTTTYPNQFWYETDTNLLYIRNEANDAWVTLASINQSSGEWEPRTAVIQAIDSAGLAFKTDEGTTRISIADDGSVTVNTSLDVDNIKIDGNSITSTDTNGNINITPNGTGKVVLDGLSYPTADGTDGQVLTTDGSGNIAFEDAGGAGKVLQVVEQRITNSTFSTTATQFTTVTDFDASVTPSSTSSKILVHFNVNGGSETQATYMKVLRNGSTQFVGDGSGQVECASACSKVSGGEGVGQSQILFLDAPATTSEVTYLLQVRQRDAGTFRLNINNDGTTGSTTKPIAISSIILMEIAE